MGGLSARKADNLTAICDPIVSKMWEPRRPTPLWASTAWYRDSFTVFFFFFLLYPPSNLYGIVLVMGDFRRVLV
jgi:hypothetical protein